MYNKYIFVLLSIIAVLLITFVYYIFRTRVVYKPKFKNTKTHCVKIKSPLVIQKPLEEITKESDIIDPLIYRFRKGDERAILDILRLYMYGNHPFVLPDTMTASKIALFISNSNIFSNFAKIQARELIKELRYEPFIQNTTLPQDIMSRIQNNIPEMFTIKVLAVDLPNELIIADNTENDNNTLFDVDDVDVDLQHRIMAEIEANRQMIQGSQNVHSSTVQNAAKNIIDHYATATASSDDPPNSDHISREIHDILKDSKEAGDAIKVLNSLEDSHLHSRYNKSEKEIFDIIYNSVKDNNDAKTILFKSLASAIENNHIVCSTGKIVRIIGSLDGLGINEEHGLPTLKSEQIIDQEIAALAINVKKRILDSLDKEKQAEYELKGNEEIEKCMKDEFHKSLTDTYSNLMSKEMLDLKYEHFSAGF